MATSVIRVVAGTMPRRTMPASSMKLRARASRSSPAALNRAYPDRLHFKTRARVSKRTTEEKGNDASVQAVHWTRQCVTRS